MKQIILITDTFVSINDSKKYGLEYFKNKGFKTFIFKLNFIYKNYVLTIEKDKSAIENNSLEELKINLKKIVNNKTFLIINFYPNFKNYKIFLLFKKYNLRRINLLCSYLPIQEYDKNRNFLFVLFRSLILKYYFNITSDIILYSGKLSIQNQKFLIDKNTELISSHSFDFENILKLKNSDYYKPKNDEYAVFIDQNILNHPDIISLNEEYANRDKYYLELNQLFNDIEKEYNLFVIILAHPTSNYKIHNPFNNRKIVSNKTNLYIKNSKLVLSHYSTAINYAVIFNKPIISILSNHYHKNFIRHIKISSVFLKSTLIDLSTYCILPKHILDFEENFYNEYFKNFISDKKNNFKSVYKILYENLVNK